MAGPRRNLLPSPRGFADPGGVPVELPGGLAPGTCDPAGVTAIPPVTLAGRGERDGGVS